MPSVCTARGLVRPVFGYYFSRAVAQRFDENLLAGYDYDTIDVMDGGACAMPCRMEG